MGSDFGDKARSIGAPRRLGSTETRVHREGGARLVERRHWDGRQDAIVTPPTVRMSMRMHRTGTKTGTVAEVRPMTPKEVRERHGE